MYFSSWLSWLFTVILLTSSINAFKRWLSKIRETMMGFFVDWCAEPWASRWVCWPMRTHKVNTGLTWCTAIVTIQFYWLTIMMVIRHLWGLQCQQSTINALRAIYFRVGSAFSVASPGFVARRGRLALKANFRARCRSCSMTNSFVTNGEMSYCQLILQIT